MNILVYDYKEHFITCPYNAYPSAQFGNFWIVLSNDLIASSVDILPVTAASRKSLICKNKQNSFNKFLFIIVNKISLNKLYHKVNIHISLYFSMLKKATLRNSNNSFSQIYMQNSVYTYYIIVKWSESQLLNQLMNKGYLHENC